MVSVLSIIWRHNLRYSYKELNQGSVVKVEFEARFASIRFVILYYQHITEYLEDSVRSQKSLFSFAYEWENSGVCTTTLRLHGNSDAGVRLPHEYRNAKLS